MVKKEVTTGLGVYALLMIYAGADPGIELSPENQDNSTVSKSPSEGLMPKRLNSRISECLERHSCLKASLTEFGDLTCNCDGLCEFYDDCCHDYNRSSPVEGVLPSPELIDCVKLSGTQDYNFPYWYHTDFFVVSRCPVDYGDIFIRKCCESSDDEFNSQPFLRLPVNGRKSRVLYRNWHCAVCNQELDVVFWEVWKETRKSFESLIYSSSGHVPRTSSYDSSTNDFLGFYFENPNGYTPRRCLNSVVRKCAENWTDQETAMRCEGRLQATAYVNGFLGRTYRNPDCEICNHAKESNTYCYEWPQIQGGQKIGVVSTKILFTINSKAMKLSGKVDVLPECEWGTVYDPSAKICREVLCAEGSEGDNSRCKTINATKEFLSLTESLNCTEFVKLNASGFTFFNNQSSLVHRTRSFYAITDYVIDTDYAYICLSYVGLQNLQNLHDEIDMISFKYDRIQGILFLVGSIISLTSLFLLFVVYLMFPVLRNVPGKCVMCLALSLFSAHLLFIFVSNPGPVCFYLSAAIHFAFLASFCWMNVLAIDICRTFASRTINSDSRSSSKHFIIYSLYSWSLPAAITGICLILDIAEVDDRIRPYYGRQVCWITNPRALLVFFLVQVAMLLTANFVLFAITACALRRSANDSRMAAKESTSRKARLLLHAKLSVIMGLPWILGYVGTLTHWTAIWYLFIIFNSMQGTFLCVSFVCTKRVFRLMRYCLPCGRDRRSAISASTENKDRRTQTMSVELSSCQNQNAAKTF